MKLFHGTNRKFENIDLEKSKDKRDFGKGFYTTTIFEQAEKWAKNQLVRYGGEGSFVKEFEFQQDSSLKIKVFSEMNAEWLEFVKICRTEGVLASGENNLHESGEINQKKSKEKSHYQF